jgi:hypothetical protein
MLSVAYPMCAFMCVVVIGAGWGFYGFLSKNNKSTLKCSQTYTCNDKNDFGGLPGGQRDVRFPHTPWSIGGRDCALFDVDKNRCKVPVESNMDSACCVCGSGRSQRDYAGPTSDMYKNWPKPPHPLLPIQHTGKTATHLTQCCACHDEAVRQALVGKSGKSKTKMEANLHIDGNPRGGVLKCNGEESIAWNYRTEILDRYMIVCGIVTGLLAICAGICCYYFFKARRKDSGVNFSPIGPASDAVEL